MFGETIRSGRYKKNMTQQELANKLYVERTTVAKWELNKNRPRPEMLTKISEVLEIPIETLVCENNQTQKNNKANMEINEKFINLSSKEDVINFVEKLIKDFRFDKNNEETLKNWTINYLYATILLELERRDRIKNEDDVFDIYDLIIDLRESAVNQLFGDGFKEAFDRHIHSKGNEAEETVASIYEIYSNLPVPVNFQTTLLNLSSYISSQVENDDREIAKYLHE